MEQADEIANAKILLLPIFSPVYPTATSTAEPENVSNEDVVSNLDDVAANDKIGNAKIQRSSTIGVSITTTAPVSLTGNNSKEEGKNPKTFV